MTETKTPPPSSIIMADDHALVIEGLKSILSPMSEVACTDMALNTHELLIKMRDKQYDIVLLDIELNGENGLEVIQDLRHINKNISIIVCTVHEEIWTAHALLKANPEGIVLKLSGVEHIKKAIQAVRKGEKYYCPRFEKLQRKLSSLPHSAIRRNLPTPREIEVLRAIARGLSSCEIANELFLTENTIESYRKNLMVKLEARNVADLIVKGIEKGYIEVGYGQPT